MINFPDSPSVGQIFQSGTLSWQWTGVKWIPSTPAATVDALAINGLQYNGRMEISQESGTTLRTTSGYILDGWSLNKSGTSVTPSGQYTPGIYPANINFSAMLAVTVTTASASLATGDFQYVAHRMEGLRVARLAWGTAQAQPITVAFWTAHHRTGVYSVSIQNYNNSRTYIVSYTQNAADTWEYKTATIPGDTTGTWNADNSIGIQLLFTMASGTQWIAPLASTWYGINYVAGPGQVNCVGATTDVFRLTGVIALPGSAAPTQANQPFCFRPIDEELLLCKRYFYNGVPPLRGIVASATMAGRMAARHPVAMRAVPTVTMPALLPIWDAAIITTLSNISTNYSSADVLEIEGVPTAATMTVGRICLVYQAGGGNLSVDARL